MAFISLKNLGDKKGIGKSNEDDENLMKTTLLAAPEAETPTEIENDHSTKRKIARHSLRIDDHLYTRLSEHLNMTKYVTNQDFSKSNWIAKAIQEKLEREDHKSPEELTKDQYLNIQITKETNVQIENRVKLVQQIRPGFSKKQWIIEAFYAKLDRDETKAKKLLEEKMRLENA